MERQPIRELQGYLRLLSEEYPRIPQLKRDGIFGPLTTEAVQEFQRQFEMEATGIVDFATWDQIFRAYQIADLRRNPAHYRLVFPIPNQTFGPGDRGSEIVFIQTMLNDLSEVFDNIAPVRLLGIYDETTEKNIREIQKLSRLPETGFVDADTWNALLNTYAAYRSGQ